MRGDKLCVKVDAPRGDSHFTQVAVVNKPATPSSWYRNRRPSPSQTRWFALDPPIAFRSSWPDSDSVSSAHCETRYRCYRQPVSIVSSPNAPLVGALSSKMYRRQPPDAVADAAERRHGCCDAVASPKRHTQQRGSSKKGKYIINVKRVDLSHIHHKS